MSGADAAPVHPDGPVPRSPAEVLDALGDPTRRAILEILATGPAPVHAIADRLPVSRPAVSRHLRLLKGAGLVDDEPLGAQRVYRLRAEGASAARAYFERLWGEAEARFRLAAENLNGKGAVAPAGAAVDDADAVGGTS